MNLCNYHCPFPSILSCVLNLLIPYENLLSLRCRLTPLHLSGEPQPGEEIQEEDIAEEAEE